MTTKVSSKRVAALAARVLAGKDYSTADVRTLAASVVAQFEPRRGKAAIVPPPPV